MSQRSVTSVDNVGGFSRRMMVAVGLAAGLALTGCKVPDAAAPTPPAAALAMQQPTCSIAASGLRPLVVEWAAADRAMLEATAKSGVAAVRYDGCEMHVLPRCDLGGQYDFVATAPKRDEIRIFDADHLWTELPLGAARLEGSLLREGQLNVELEVAGRLQATGNKRSLASAGSACAGATHTVDAMTLGAFSIYSGAQTEVGAGVSVSNVGAGGSRARKRSVLRTDGRFEACGTAADGIGPDPECSAVLRVELHPLSHQSTPAKPHPLAHPSTPEPYPELVRPALQPNAAQQKQLDRLHSGRIAANTTAGITGAAGFGTLVFVAVRAGQISANQQDRDMAQSNLDSPLFDRTDTQAEIDRLDAQMESRRKEMRTAGYVTAGLLASTIAMIGVSAGIRAKERRLRRDLRARTRVAPMLSPTHAGLSIAGRF